MSAKHTLDPKCPSCDEKLATAEPYLSTWFYKMKEKFSDIHISWAFRGMADQEAAFNANPKKSNCHYPNSPHNKIKDGKPRSLALDLFQEKVLGSATFDPVYCAKINEFSESLNEPIQWGGKFKSLGDSDHFQLRVPE